MKMHQASSSICAQVERVSLNPDKRPKPKSPPAKEVPAKKELNTGGSKEVRHLHPDYLSEIMVLEDSPNS